MYHNSRTLELEKLVTDSSHFITYCTLGIFERTSSILLPIL